MLRLRDRQSVGEIEQKSQDIIDQVLHLHEYVRARGIACYVNKDSEVNTRPLIRAALDQEKRVLIPVVKKGDIELFFSETKDLGSELAPGTFGILEPKPENVHPVSLDTVDVIFVPGIVWDREGYRLGWGRGYFDRVIKKVPQQVSSAGLAIKLALISMFVRMHVFVLGALSIYESHVTI